LALTVLTPIFWPCAIIVSFSSLVKRIDPPAAPSGLASGIRS
jgi:hypothetical protein